jgi:hypothetical protein
MALLWSAIFLLYLYGAKLKLAAMAREISLFLCVLLKKVDILYKLIGMRFIINGLQCLL